MYLKSNENLLLTIKEIQNIKYHYEIKDIIKEEEKENLINLYLQKIKDINNIAIFKNNANKLMDILDFFSNPEKYGYLEEQAEDITMKLIDKVINGKLKLNINLLELEKNYYSSNLLKKEKGYITNWIILVLGVLIFIENEITI